MKARELRLAGVRSMFFAMAGVLVATLLIAYFVGNVRIQIGERRSLHEEIDQEVHRAFSTVQDAETGQRGYLLTGRREYLEPYEEAVDAMPARVRRLDESARRQDLPPATVEKFERLIREKLEEMGRTIAVARERGIPGAMEIVKSDEGKRTMDQIRDVLGELEAVGKERLRAIENDEAWLTSLRNGAFIASAAVNLGFLAWAYGRIRREMSRRYVADLEAQRHRDILAVSLASIGDAVIITDTDARVAFLNDVAVELTGWPREEAIGQPCARVFHIINETSREMVESPVDLVLRSGKVVGLANHTLLIRKDGTEVPIDDSGAPVRESDGSIRGVVLVFRDFTPYKDAQREQAELKDRLEIANKAKDDFIAVLSHELRTPLTPVLATLSRWESGGELPGDLAAEVRMLNRNVRLELRLIDDLLDLTRIGRGELTLHPEIVDAHGLLTAVVEIFRPELERRQVRMDVRLEAECSHVDGDPTRLQQVFWNILGNAGKFTPDGGRIEIVTSNDGGTFRAVFTDNGRGMSAETLDGLFRPFAGSGRPAYHSGGLGIGLTISQSLMRSQGGEIRAESAGGGRGSTFSVTMPAVPNNRISEPEDAEDNQPEKSRCALAILLLEDHVDSADVVARLLRAMGHSVEVAGTVAQGLETLHARTFDLVLSDIGLPDGTGLEFIARARSFSATPMIALTGYAMDEDVAKYRAAGFLHQLTKPIRFDQLEDLISRFAQGGERAFEVD